MEHLIIRVDPHKLSATIEVVDRHEKLLGSGRFTTDQAGYTGMRTYAKTRPERVWAVEGANGAGRPLASGCSRRASASSTCQPSSQPGLWSSTPATTARPTPSTRTRSPWPRSRTQRLRVLRVDGELEAPQILTDLEVPSCLKSPPVRRSSAYGRKRDPSPEPDARSLPRDPLRAVRHRRGDWAPQ